MLTHDTKEALVQTTDGQIAVCRHLFGEGFQYVLLRELQSDRIEGEFGVYRQSTGSNSFMMVGDVFTAFKARLTRFAASVLGTLDEVITEPEHVCIGMVYQDAHVIEACMSEITLHETEVLSCAYVAGWLESKCSLNFTEDDTLIDGKPLEFIQHVSRGSLTIPHVVVFEFVQAGLRFMNHAKSQACCRRKLGAVLDTISLFYDYGINSKDVINRSSNVLMHGLHNLEKDHQSNAKLYQTSLKKARLAN